MYALIRLIHGVITKPTKNTDLHVLNLNVSEPRKLRLSLSISLSPQRQQRVMLPINPDNFPHPISHSIVLVSTHQSLKCQQLVEYHVMSCPILIFSLLGEYGTFYCHVSLQKLFQSLEEKSVCTSLRIDFPYNYGLLLSERT